MIDYINYAYSEEVTYQKKAALESIFNQGRRKNLTDLALQKIVKQYVFMKLLLKIEILSTQ